MAKASKGNEASSNTERPVAEIVLVSRWTEITVRVPALGGSFVLRKERVLEAPLKPTSIDQQTLKTLAQHPDPESVVMAIIKLGATPARQEPLL